MDFHAITDLFQETYQIRALIAALMVGISCGILGCFIVLRNMALIGDALSHAILPGVVVGYVIAGYSILAFFTGAVVAGFITALLITWLQRNVKTREDSAIGIIFTVMFAIGIMGISIINRKGIHLDMKDFLFGTILGVSNNDIWLTSLITLFVIICVAVFFRYFFITSFQPAIAKTLGVPASVMHYFLMLLLSFAIVASLQSVGVILVVAMLIIPASTAYLITNRLKIMLVLSALFGALATILGLIAAILINTTPGPAMTVMAAILYALTIVFAPEKGFLSRMRIKRKRKHRILLEDVLKQLVRMQENKSFTLEALSERVGISQRRAEKLLSALRRQGLLQSKDNSLELTPAGLKSAFSLIRAHRLWETYLSEKLGVPVEQIHEQAEKYEHLLPPAFLDDIEQSLGYPILDPHGSPIPQTHREFTGSLLTLLEKQKAIIMADQPSEKIVLKLWELGITPNTPFIIKSTDGEFVEIELNGEVVNVPRDLAGIVKVSMIGK